MESKISLHATCLDTLNDALNDNHNTALTFYCHSDKNKGERSGSTYRSMFYKSIRHPPMVL